jgi:prolipoprotein diacylglyceryl transferase
MRPILVNIPAKLLFVAALVLAVAGVVRDLIRRRRDPTLPLSSTPLYLLIGAEILVKLKTGSLILSLAALQQPWTPVPIYSYGVMLGTSLMVGWLLAMRLAKQDGIGQEAAASIYMWSAIWSIIGSRVLWWITTPNVPLVEIIFINRGGLVAYGGMIGGFLASWYGCRKHGIPLLRWADVAAPSVVLGTAITRVGCLLFGCDFGRRSDVPWSISFPKGSPAWNHHVEDFRLAKDAAWSYPVHPTQIYESLVGLSLFALLMLLRRYRRFSGQVFLGWVFGYGILRSIIEIYRDDDDRGLYTLPFTHLSLSTSQIIGIVSVVLGALLLINLRRRYQRDPAALRLWEQPAVAGGAPEEAASSSSKSAPKRRKRR